MQRALENIARNYILQAQAIKEETALMTNRQQMVENDKKSIDLYQKSLPYLEKLEQILLERNASESENNGVLMLLRNVYYNLSVMGVDKSAELEKVEASLDLN